MTDRGILPPAPPPPGPFAARAFDHYLTGLARKHFASVRWGGQEDWRAWAPLPTLVIANHTNWWDGFLSHQITRAMGRHFRILMEARNLARYQIFRRIGALPIERRSRTQGMRDLAVATACLAPDALVWIYPQGERRPASEPIAALEGGAAWMVERHGGPLRILPVAFRYPFLSEQQAEPLALLGASWVVQPEQLPTRQRLREQIAAGLRETVAELDARLAREALEGLSTLIAGRPSINTRLDAVRHRLGMLDDYDRRNG